MVIMHFRYNFVARFENLTIFVEDLIE